MKIKESWKKMLDRLNRFFFPGPGATRWMLFLPYLTLGVITIVLVTGGVAVQGVITGGCVATSRGVVCERVSAGCGVPQACRVVSERKKADGSVAVAARV